MSIPFPNLGRIFVLTMGSASIRLLSEVCLFENRGAELPLPNGMSAFTPVQPVDSNQAHRKDLPQPDPY